ncbi:hypothetical protein PMIN02_008067 [Paraphaeosphaeria minitans]
MGMIKHTLLSVLSLASCLISAASLSQDRKPTVAFKPGNGNLPLASKGSSVNLVLDAADWPGVLRAAHDVVVDFGRVTGTNGTLTTVGSGASNQTVGGSASVIFNVTGISKDWIVSKSSTKRKGVIIAGTIGNSSLIDALIKSGKLDVSKIEGEWEAYTSAVIKNPLNGTAEALVIAGSDKRGTIYGLYDVSEQIGVSPWHWFADVPPKSHSSIYALRSTKVQKTPSVKYRGFFINDEAPALTGWANGKYPKSTYGSSFGAEFYSHVFELLLRSRANYLWPAMWSSMFNVDDPRSQPLADAYGVVMGSSHTEPMVRATQEWTKVAKGSDSSWSWATNNATLYKFFTEGAERAKPYENVVTVGMRGYHDTAMSADTQTSVLEAVVEAQEEIMSKVWGNASEVPQVWCLYKEVQDYFEAGMKVPDWVTLLWTEDNWQNIRRLPVGDEKKRSGGAGVYYHFDYVGDSRNFKWINTIQLQKTYEQMSLAHAREADRLWVVNVGDIKPYEIPISHWFDIAYDIEAYDETSVPKWIENWAKRTFDEKHAKTISSIVDKYGHLSNMRKYEWVEPGSYSIISYEEADKLQAQWEDVGDQAQEMYDELPENEKGAFYELILHPVLAGGNFINVQVAGARNQIYSGQGRTSANDWMQETIDLMGTDHELTQKYHRLFNGRWNHMMDQTHLGYQGYWQQPMRQSTPFLRWVQTSERSLSGDMGVAVEGSNATIPGDDIWHNNGGGSLDLPAATPFTPRRWIDIFSMGTNSFNWNITTEPFIKLSKTAGSISPGDDDARVYIDVDWTKVPDGYGKKVALNISSSQNYGTQFSRPTVNLMVNKTSVPSSFKGFVENAGQLAIEAEHYSRLSSSGNLSYTVLPRYGRTLSALKLSSPLAEGLSPSSAPALEYDFYTFTPTTSAKGLNLTLILSPTHNINPKKPLAYVAQVDDKPQQRRQFVTDQKQPDFPVGWGTAVAQNAWLNTTKWGEVSPGKHTLKLWLVEANVVLQKLVMDLGGVQYSHNGPPESYRV